MAIAVTQVLSARTASPGLALSMSEPQAHSPRQHTGKLGQGHPKTRRQISITTAASSVIHHEHHRGPQWGLGVGEPGCQHPHLSPGSPGQAGGEASKGSGASLQAHQGTCSHLSELEKPSATWRGWAHGQQAGAEAGEPCGGLHSTLSCSVNPGGSPSVEGPAAAQGASKGVYAGLSGRYTAAALCKAGGSSANRAQPLAWPPGCAGEDAGRGPQRAPGPGRSEQQGPLPGLAATSLPQRVSPALALCLPSSGSGWRKARGQGHGTVCPTRTTAQGRLRGKTRVPPERFLHTGPSRRAMGRSSREGRSR